VAARHRVQGSGRQKNYPTSLLFTILVRYLWLHLFSTESGLHVEYEVPAAEAGRPGGS
jgi:hypothetical protein